MLPEYLWRSDTAIIYPEDPEEEGAAPLGSDGDRGEARTDAAGRRAQAESRVTARKPIGEQVSQRFGYRKLPSVSAGTPLRERRAAAGSRSCGERCR